MKIACWFGALVLVAMGAFHGPTPAIADEPLKIGVTIWPGWMPWWIVEEKGFFQKVGVNAKIIHFKRHPDDMAAFAANRLDGDHMILADVIVPAAQGIPGRVVLITDESSGADGILATPAIKTIADFKGKRVACEFGGVSQLLLIKALATAGLTTNDVSMVNMSSEDAGTAFLAGAVDVAVTWEPYLSQAVKAGKGSVIFSSAQTPGLIPDLVVFRAEAIKSRPEDVKKVIEAWKMALDFISSNHAEAIDIMARGAGVSSAEMEENLKGIKLYSLDDNIQQFGAAPDGPFYKTGMEQAQFLQKNQLIDTVPDVPSLIDPSFVRAVGAK